MTPEQLYDELNVVFSDWDGLLANPRFCRNDRSISWTGFSGGRLKEPVSIEQILAIVEDRQFSFQSAEDGSIFQLLYYFDRANTLQLARLAFYLLKTRGSFEQGTAELISNAWIRIDYDLQGANGLLHHDCHLHIHGFPEGRVIVNGVPGPRQFVEFVIAMCYPDHYKVHRLNQDGNPDDPKTLQAINRCSQPPEATNSGPPMLHLALP